MQFQIFFLSENIALCFKERQYKPVAKSKDISFWQACIQVSAVSVCDDGQVTAPP